MHLIAQSTVTADVGSSEVLLAHPIALLAIPALAPAVVLIAVVLWIARRDRLAEQAEQAEGQEADDAAPEEKPKRRSRLEIG